MTARRLVAPEHPPLEVDLSPERARAVRDIVTGRGGRGDARLPVPPDAAAAGYTADGASWLIAHRGSHYLEAGLDRRVELTGRRYETAWRLAGIATLRLLAVCTGRRRYHYPVGAWTVVHCLRADALDAFSALAALDGGDTGPALALVDRWAGDVRTLAAGRPAQSRDWLLGRLALDLHGRIPHGRKRQTR